MKPYRMKYIYTDFKTMNLWFRDGVKNGRSSLDILNIGGKKANRKEL